LQQALGEAEGPSVVLEELTVLLGGGTQGEAEEGETIRETKDGVMMLWLDGGGILPDNGLAQVPEEGAGE